MNLACLLLTLRVNLDYAFFLAHLEQYQLLLCSSERPTAVFRFNNAGGVPRGHFSQNQFGGTISGPIVKNKTFFFFDAQTLTSRKATTTTSTVPTPLMKQGNFTELKPTVTDPKVAGQSGCVVGNIISKSCIDPTGQKLLALFPDPNIPGFVAK
jgi:hypothetical protein